MSETPPSPAHQVCVRCVMDTSDPNITFNTQGECSHCHQFDTVVASLWHRGPEGSALLQSKIAEMKRNGQGKDYDCILGLSGGVDSSFMAREMVRWGLRPLVVHVDAGWNSELAVKNIENVVKKLNLDLYTYVVDWEEMRDLQVAFLRASVPNQDIPQDHAYFAKLYTLAVEKNIKYVISGANFATESILPSAWGYDAYDLRHLKAIHKRFGKHKLKTFPLMGFFRHYGYNMAIKKLEVVRPLNWMNYDKEAAKHILETELDWRYYGGKHYESRFTKFFQGHYLPSKFGFDKRKAHLSSMILAGGITRDAALEELQKPSYPPEELQADLDFVAKKLGLTRTELDELMALPPRQHRDYPVSEGLFQTKNKIRDRLRKLGFFPV